MLNITNELKAKLLAAQSEEEVTELLKANGREITAEEAEHIFAYLQKGAGEKGGQGALP